MNTRIIGQAPSAERTYMQGMLTEVLRDVTTMDEARTALAHGGDLLLGYPQFKNVDIRLEPPFLERGTPISRVLAKASQMPVLSKLVPTSLGRPTATLEYSKPKSLSGRVFCGASDGRYIGIVSGSAHLAATMGDASLCYDASSNMVEGSAELCRLTPKEVGRTKHMLLRKETGQPYSGVHPLFQLLFNRPISKSKGADGNKEDTGSSSLIVDALGDSSLLQSSSTVSSGLDGASTSPFMSELALYIRDVVGDVPEALRGCHSDARWEFAAPRPANQLSQLDGMTRSLHFKPAVAVSGTQFTTFVTHRHIWQLHPSGSGKVTLDQYVKVGRQFTKTGIPVPNTSVLLNIEPFTRFHYRDTPKDSRKRAVSKSSGLNIPSRLALGIRAEAAFTTAAYLSDSLMLSAYGSVHAAEAFDRRRLRSMARSFSSGSASSRIRTQTRSTVHFDEQITQSMYSSLGDTVKGRLQGFAQAMSPTSFSYVKRKIVGQHINAQRQGGGQTNAYFSAHKRGYMYTPLHDGYEHSTSPRITLDPSTGANGFAGDGLLTMAHLAAIWQPRICRQSSILRPVYVLAGIEAAGSAESPTTLLAAVSQMGINQSLYNRIKYASFVGFYLKYPLPCTATVSVVTNTGSRFTDRLTYGFSLII